MQETRVRSLGWEDPLEKAMAPHSSTLAWKIPWTEESGRLQSTWSQRVGHDWVTSLHCLSSRFMSTVWTSLVAQTVKHLSTMWETRVRALGWEDPLEKEMAIHFSTIAWEIPWTEEPGRLQSMGLQRVRHDWVTSLSLSGRYYKCQNNHQIQTHMTQKLELSEMKSKRIMITMLKMLMKNRHQERTDERWKQTEGSS